ncbi:MAG: hypothetical protein KDB22_04440 [Planctomycetales bacterium]|nr:hypothetical protein [Planctomycetales bacterium]
MRFLFTPSKLALPTITFWVATTVLVCVFTYKVVHNQWFCELPKPVGDGLDYENIGFHLYQGDGFVIDNQNAAWRAPYEARRTDYAYHLQSTPRQLIATGRPPLFPVLIAAVYGVFGRNQSAMAAVRILLGIALAIAGGLSCALVASLLKQSSPAIVGASFTCLLFATNRTLISYTTDFLTEPLALLLTQGFVSLAAVRLVSITTASQECSAELKTNERPPNKTSKRTLGMFQPAVICMGAIFAGMILVRSLFVLWLPIVATLLFFSEQGTWRTRFVNTAIFLIVCIAICSPWWIRNIVQLRALMPLGTQGPITLLGGYCDQSVADGGQWQMQPELELRQEFVDEQGEHREEGNAIASGTAAEMLIAQEAKRRVWEWIFAHPDQLPALALLRIRTHWGPYSGPSMLWKLAGLLGAALLLNRRNAASWWLVGLPITSTLVVAVLYATGGRFLVPLYGALFALAGCGAAGIWSFALGFVESPRAEREG